LPEDPRIVELARKVQIVADDRMGMHFPRRWSACVTAVGTDGDTHEREVVNLAGDPGTGFGWEAVGDKLVRVTGLPADALSPLRSACAGLATGGNAANVVNAAGF